MREPKLLLTLQWEKQKETEKDGEKGRRMQTKSE